MLQEFLDVLIWLLGHEQMLDELSTIQIITRTIIVYGVALLLIRLGKRRFLGGYTAFDILMGFVIGSILSRTITGRENLLSSSIVILALVAIHYAISYLTFYFGRASNVVKDSERRLIKDGKIVERAMQKSKLGENDLLQALRKKGNVETPEDVAAAYLERDGSITVIPKKQEPKIIDIEIKEGVQVVKVEIRN